MTRPVSARPLAPYVIGLLGVGLALAGTMAAADLWPGSTGDYETNLTNTDRGIAYLVGLVGWGFACVLWAIAVLLAGRRP